MPQPKQRKTFPILLDDDTKNAASSVTRAQGVPLGVAIRSFLSALIKKDKRALSILEDAKQKKAS